MVGAEHGEVVTTNTNLPGKLQAMNKFALTLSLIAATFTGAAAAYAAPVKKAQKQPHTSSNVQVVKTKVQTPAKGTTISRNGRNDQTCRGDRKRCFGNLFGLSGVELAAPPGKQAPFGNAKGSNAPQQFGNGKGSNAPEQFGNGKGSNAPAKGYAVGSPPPKGYPTGTPPVNQGYSTRTTPPTAPPYGRQQAGSGTNHHDKTNGYCSTSNGNTNGN